MRQGSQNPPVPVGAAHFPKRGTHDPDVHWKPFRQSASEAQSLAQPPWTQRRPSPSEQSRSVVHGSQGPRTRHSLRCVHTFPEAKVVPFAAFFAGSTQGAEVVPQTLGGTGWPQIWSATRLVLHQYPPGQSVSP